MNPSHYLLSLQKKHFQICLLSIYVVCFCFFVGSCKNEKANDSTAIEDNKEGSINKAFDAQKIIASLENHNPEPSIKHTMDSQFAEFDKTYDFEEQNRIPLIISSLAKHGEEAWPELVAHLNDSKYSMTYHVIDEEAENYSIGRVCHSIISDIISQGYYIHLRPIFSEEVWKRLRNPKIDNLSVWCEARKDKKLYELQIEICEWSIPEIEKLENVSQPEKLKVIDAIKNQIEILKKTKKAVPLKEFGERSGLRPYHRSEARFKED